MARTLSIRGVCAVALAVLLVPFSAAPLNQTLHESRSPVVAESPASLSLNGKFPIPGVLSESEAQIYRQAFSLQRKAKWQEADALLEKVYDGVLKGHVLAARYLNPRYPAEYAELQDWLERYADHPQAEAILRRAAARKPASATLPEIARAEPLAAGGAPEEETARTYRPSLISPAAWDGRAEAKRDWDAIERFIAAHEVEKAASLLSDPSRTVRLSAEEINALRWELAEQYLYSGQEAQAARWVRDSRDASPAMRWISGLAAWQQGEAAEAARQFAAMADAHGLSPAEEAAAAFWAHRAYTKLGETDEARRYLRIAAGSGRNFYAMLARHALGQPAIARQSAALDEKSSETLYRIPAIRRAVALSQAGEEDAAAQELRAYFPAAPRREQLAVLDLTRYLNLPSVQTSMAAYLLREGEAVEYALYPMPQWQPHSGFNLEPALVFALARQESGFKPSALGSGGALGVMQLMPKTAQLMQKSLGNPPRIALSGMMEPEANLTLGQHYLEHLMDVPSVGNNLIYLFAAYNAGPGKLAQWRARMKQETDALLFLEKIPYATTRSYVKQVMANYWAYQELQGETPVSAAQLAAGRAPLYRTAPASLAQK